MRCVDDAVQELGHERVFFEGPESGFINRLDWGTLLHLVGEDYAVIKDPAIPSPAPFASILLSRLDGAREAVGAPTVFAHLDPARCEDLAGKLDDEAARLVDELFGSRPDKVDDKTVVIEFARGGPEGATPPLAPPHGYQWNLAQLPPTLLEKAAVLYIWVTPEESRRKNVERADPGDPGSILAHSAPEEVMRGDYGCDDIEYLMQQSPHPATIQIEAHGRTWTLPIARFDNREDKTTFLRGDPETWPPEQIQALHEGLEGPMRALWEAYRKLRG
jgi:hypothetical protein